MKPIAGLLAGGLVVLLAASDAWAQGGRGPGRRQRPVEWENAIEDGLGKVGDERKYLFIYVHPPAETDEPTEFRNQDILEASRGEFVFVRFPFDKENSVQQEWKIVTAPTFIGADKRGNEVVRSQGSMSIDAIRTVLKNTPDAVAKLEATIRSLASKLDAADRSGDRTKTVRAAMDLIKTEKKGFPEIAAASRRLDELAVEEFRRADIADTADEAMGTAIIEAVVREFAGAPAAVEADIRLARRDASSGNTSGALTRLNRTLKQSSPALKAKLADAQKELDAMLADGMSQIEVALSLASQDREGARESLRRIQRDYAGTDVARKAAEAFKTLP